MFVVGITGGIGSGKTTAADRLHALGVSVIDADLIAREVVAPGQPAIEEIIDKFGDDIVDENQNLNRRRLRQIVFAEPKLRKILEDIVHPKIHQEIHEQLNRLSSPYAVVVIPLLAESKRDYKLDRVLVIDTECEQQIKRVIQRDQKSDDQVKRIINSQASRKTRNSIADDIVMNTGTLKDLHAQMDRLHEKYLELSAKMAGD